MFVRRDASSRSTCLVVGVVVAVILLAACVIAAIGFALIEGPDVFDSDEAESPTATATTTSGEPDDGPAIVSVLDVDQGQAVAIIAPDGSAALIDAGRSGTRIEDEIAPYLRSLGVDDLDYLILSHPDQDHLGGMPAVLEQFEVGVWVDPAIPTTNQTYGETLEVVLDREIEALLARQGDELRLGEVVIEILWPVDDMLTEGDEVASNDNSTVARVTYDGVSVLIPGDLEDDGEAALVERYGGELRSDVLVAGHHGSNTSSTGAFLDAATPEVAIISVGGNNPYGHPHDEVLQRLRFRGIEQYRTDLDGTVNVIIDDGAYEIETVETSAGG